MSVSILFLANSVLLGAGLAMDAFAVSLANGLNEPEMKRAEWALLRACLPYFRRRCR